MTARNHALIIFVPFLTCLFGSTLLLEEYLKNRKLKTKISAKNGVKPSKSVNLIMSEWNVPVYDDYEMKPSK